MPAELLEKAPALPGSGGPGEGGYRAGGEGGPSGDGSGALIGDPARFGLWAFLGTVSMLFIGFTSAFILRRASGDWRPLPAPSVLWLNTFVLLASSATLEVARRRLRSWDARSAQALLGATGLLGFLFLAGQVVAWQRLAARGIFLASNPHSSFFYLLTCVHGAHLLGGLAWFAVAFLRLRRLATLPGGDGLRLFATYWHFLDALWVYLLFLLFVL
jgi:cytochrome c oxidase subunit III